MILKTCKQCNEEKPNFDFSWRMRIGQYSNICRKCNSMKSSAAENKMLRKKFTADSPLYSMGRHRRTW